jgi:recombination protein RecT
MTAIAKHQPQGGAVAAPERVEANIQMMADKFRPLLGDDDATARFCRVAINAVQQTKDMHEVVTTQEGRDSIYTACLQAASDGLLLDKRCAALVVYFEKGKGKVAKYMPMYQGLLELAHGSGVISKIVVQLVYAADTFSVSPTAIGCPVHHELPEDAFSDRGEIRGGYAYAVFKDGKFSDAQVMSVADINKIMARSKTSEWGPWKTDWSEMARKTLIRRLVKYLPRTIPGLEKFDSASHRVDEHYALEGPGDAPALEAPARKEPMAKKLLSPPAPPAAPAVEVEQPKQKAKAAPKAAAKSKSAETPQVPLEDEGYDDRSRGGWPDDEDGDV